MFGAATPLRAAIVAMAATLSLAACGAEHDVLTSGVAAAGGLVRGAASEPSATSAVPSPATTGTSASTSPETAPAATATPAEAPPTTEAEATTAAAPAEPATSAPAAEALSARGASPLVEVGEAGPPPTPPGPPAIVNRSSCRPDLGGAAAVMEIPSIGYVCPIHRGGQRTIDTGAATWFSGWPDRSEQAGSIGGPGTLWIAGHRTSHGAPFLDIPAIPDGGEVRFHVDGRIVTYRIVARTMVSVNGSGYVLSDVDGDGDLEGTAQAGYRAIFRDDLGGGMAPRLVLQTCDGRDGRVILYGDLVA